MMIVTLTSVMAQAGGEDGFTFLKLPASSHAAALGGENISLIEDDATLALHNPALLQSVSDRTISFGYMKYMEEVSYYNAQYVSVVNEKATVMGLVQYLDYGKMKETDMNGNILGDFGASDLAIGGTLSYTLAKDIVGGVTGKFIYSKIGDYSATAVAVDLGVNYYNAEKDLSVSLVARNLGGQLSAFVDEYERLPFDLQAGVTKRLKGFPLRVSLTASDLHHLDYSLIKHLAAGVDLFLGEQVYLAGGYNFRRAKDMAIMTTNAYDEEDESSHGAGLSIGGGFKTEKLRLDVSYAKYHVAGSSLMVNLGLSL